MNASSLIRTPAFADCSLQSPIASIRISADKIRSLPLKPGNLNTLQRNRFLFELSIIQYLKVEALNHA